MHVFMCSCVSVRVCVVGEGVGPWVRGCVGAVGVALRCVGGGGSRARAGAVHQRHSGRRARMGVPEVSVTERRAEEDQVEDDVSGSGKVPLPPAQGVLASRQ